MLDDEQIRELRASHARAREITEEFREAWREHQRLISRVYDAGQDDDPRTTEEAIGFALGVGRQQVQQWRKSAGEAAVPNGAG